MSLELLNHGNQGISLILLFFFLTTCLVYPKMTIFLLYFEAHQRTIEAEKERKKEKRRSISWLIIGLQ